MVELNPCIYSPPDQLRRHHVTNAAAAASAAAAATSSHSSHSPLSLPFLLFFLSPPIPFVTSLDIGWTGRIFLPPHKRFG